MKRSVVVTGASTGIGYAIAQMLAREGFHVFAGVRRRQDADRLIEEIGDELTPLVFDIADPEGLAEAARDVGERLGRTTLAGLVNNAGIATAGPLLHQPIEEFRRQLEINVVAQVAVVQAFAPLLGADRTRTGDPGRIINMSSVAGRIAAPFLGAYAASKHALEAVSDSLRRELMLYGVDVIVIEPGSVATPIWDKAESADYTPYFRTDYKDSVSRLRAHALKEGRAGFPPERVAASVLRALVAPKPPTRIPVVPGRLKNWLLPRLLPDRALDALIAKGLGLRRPER
ncbi:MAG TPA: SDR family NAD(P)-dependent oxidoreductase [Beijerinckiaceae bacterium]|nr:SDR family NAD(P)-dependent oxidoreductase [Rhodoblastus sp.]MCB1523850.1 SDR family NAD(P)-dependent oxidoreductase [Rhodoblastus sp.]MCB9998779.1 SDR family NAD(P)-dependent oxidoreductase [Methylobacteriaceae bacterium]HRY01755.1 SDR family NAD(P)-dependent oxidoreductase [Beijerinckiaceae bacterium]